jgi:hypothetical protein
MSLQSEAERISTFLNEALSLNERLSDSPMIPLHLYTMFVNKLPTDGQAQLDDVRKRMVALEGDKVVVYEAKGHLIAGRSRGLDLTRQYFDSFIRQKSEDVSERNTELLLSLVEFDSNGTNPERCRAKSTLMWRQRIFCQLVPIFVERFNALPKEERMKRSAFLRLTDPLLRMAQKIPIPMTTELCLLLPIFVEALPLGMDNMMDNESEYSLLLEGTAQLLNLVPLDKLDGQTLEILLTTFQKVLHKAPSVKITLNLLECLDILAKRLEKTRLVHFQACTVQSIAVASSSKKRLVRQKAANVRNNWELIVD